jgi:putative oxidoreductase
MKIATIIARILLGLMFVVFGLNGFLHFIPGSTAQQPGPAGAFVGALFQSGYFYMIAGLQILGGAVLLSGRFVAIGLVLLGPVIVNILCYHIFLDRSGLPIAIAVSCLFLFVFWEYRARFAGLLKV